MKATRFQAGHRTLRAMTAPSAGDPIDPSPGMQGMLS